MSNALEKSGVLLPDFVRRLGIFASTKLAEKWDNVGLLVEPSGSHMVNKILLTNDLTQEVMKESIEKSINLIISYHPPIFTPFKRLCQGNWKERIITKAIENRIAIYSPHTCYDAVKGGVNDWLLKCFGSGDVTPITQSFDHGFSSINPNGCYKMTVSFEPTHNIGSLAEAIEKCQDTISLSLSQANDRQHLEVYVFPSEAALANVYHLISSSRMIPLSSEVSKLESLPLLGYGMGRILKLQEATTIEGCVSRVKKHLEIPFVRLALARKASLTKKVSSIAVCAGSGGSVLRGVSADLYLTGEMSHHEVLHATESGRSVILCDHSNTERGFLKTLPPLMQEWFNADLSIEVSTKDRDPLTVM